MTHLQRLSIQGVRSFNPQEPQEIQFFPLTMILGPNGAGKTTIIESLKYATIGQLPPNCNGGKSFVHDVEFANQPIIRGQIRLRFMDMEKKSTTITRSMETQVKGQKNSKSSVTFRQINSVIKRDNKSFDQKSADINSELLDLIGVSKAVLNNVTFCHQEDTNWPLSEGRVLKEKFDAIFGSIEYVKILDKIKKTRENQGKHLILLGKDIENVSNLKREAADKRKQLMDEQAKFHTEQMNRKEFELKMKKINEKLEDFIEKEKNGDEIMKGIAQIEGSIEEKQKLANEIKSTCSSETLSKSKDQVEKELNNFGGDSTELETKKKELEAKLQKATTGCFVLMRDKEKISIDLDKIYEYKDKLQKCSLERDKYVKFIRKLNKFITDEDLTDNVDCERLIQLYQEKINEIQKSSTEKYSSISRRESDLKRNVQSLKDQKRIASLDIMDGLKEVIADLQKWINASEEQMTIENSDENKSTFTHKELKMQLNEFKAKVENLQGKTHDFDPEIEKLEAELGILENDKRMIEKDEQQRICEYENSTKQLKLLGEEIKKYSEQLKDAELKTSQEYTEKVKNDMKRLENEKKILSEQIYNIMQDKANFEVRKRELMDAQKYLNLQDEIVKQKESLKEHQSKMGFMDLSSIKRARSSADKELAGLETRSTVALERIREIDDRINILEEALKHPRFEDVEKKYKEKIIEKTICELTCEDLNKYYKALDYSISSFHKCKMEEINKLLEKFWQIAYQGRDIDYIKVLSDEEERSASDKRRTYNYRVVMVRNDREMDMKGRCSAGQKVLASLIIRLALAVIFCRNFAVLTLDEPTANLDKANIRAFARAVISLIKSHRNFQIIIITHDEDFLECLEPDFSEFYYKVRKNDAGYSTIIRKSLFHMHSIDSASNFFGKKDNNEEEEEEMSELVFKRPKLG